MRAKLSSRSTGRWGSSVGDKAKFGLSIPDLLATVEALRQADLLGDLRLLHFHVGSQINDIAVLKDALQEAGQIYVELTKQGAPMGFLDVGGGYSFSRFSIIFKIYFSLLSRSWKFETSHLVFCLSKIHSSIFCNYI